MTFDEFKRIRNIPGLDGLRAISVILVLSWHTGDTLWQPARGYLGVTLFFVISGFLITTLLLREEESFGSISIWRFYVRRLFRITPMYYFVILLYAVLVMGFHMAGDSSSFAERVLLLVSFNAEFAGPGAFSHAWSLGIEEKFYLLWPVFGFAILALRRYRLWLACGFLAVGLMSASFSGWNYLAIFVPIVAGVVLADLLHREPAFRMIARWTKTIPSIAIVTALLIALVLNREDTFVHIGFGLLTALALPCFVLNKAYSNFLQWSPLAYIGRRSYGIYLIHIVVLLGVGRILPLSDSSVFLSILRLSLVLVISVAIAEVLSRLIENPMIRVGRKLTRITKQGAVSSAA